jgi:hypothetical protein
MALTPVALKASRGVQIVGRAFYERDTMLQSIERVRPIGTVVPQAQAHIEI